VLEALSYLCAAGLMPTGNLSALFIDPDTNNGNVVKAKTVFGNYRKCSYIDTGGAIDFFKTKMPLEPDIWSPFQGWTGVGNPQLYNFFRYNLLDNAGKNLFDILYSPKEKTTTLEKGFRGHPSIGAAVFVNTIPLESRNPWKDFYNGISNDKEQGCRIFIVGSIFGGTGAAGLPTFAKLIRNRFKENGKDNENIKIGGLVVLPYFSFIPPAADSRVSKELHANSGNFLVSTKAALDYYHNQEESYDRLYMLGDDENPPVKKFAIGASEQRNEPHLIELIGALMGIDFFRSDFPKEDLKRSYHFLSRAFQNTITWGDIRMRTSEVDKGTMGSLRLEQSIVHLTRFAFAYLNRFTEQFVEIEKHKRSERFSWYWELFKAKEEIDESTLNERRKPLAEFCHSYLDWIAKIVNSIPEKAIKLINYEPFAEKRENQIQLLCERKEDITKYNFLEEQMDRLDKFEGVYDEKAMKKVYEEMCRPVTESEKSIEFGRFLVRLYNSTAKN